MKFIKNHFSLILVLLILILLGVGVYFAKEFFLSNDTEAIYGSRLKEIKDHPLTKEDENKIKEVLQEFSDSVTVRLAGRILYVDVYVKEGIDLETARSLGGKILENLSDDQKSYYDIQLMIGSKTNTANFPLIGYKHHAKGEFSWVNKKTES